MQIMDYGKIVALRDRQFADVQEITFTTMAMLNGSEEHISILPLNKNGDTQSHHREQKTTTTSNHDQLITNEKRPNSDDTTLFIYKDHLHSSQ